MVGAAQPAAEGNQAAKPMRMGQDSANTEETEATQHYPQAQIQEAQYTMTTDFKINNNPVQNPGKYGEGKFYIIPTYKFADNATPKMGIPWPIQCRSVFPCGNKVVRLKLKQGTMSQLLHL